MKVMTLHHSEMDRKRKAPWTDLAVRVSVRILRKRSGKVYVFEPPVGLA